VESQNWEFEIYQTASGESPFQEWIDRLKDKDGHRKIISRLDRLLEGNFGDCKFLEKGISELQVNSGPDYRIYFARSGNRVVLLLCGGDKRSQTQDISSAIAYWQDYQRQQDE
jgi:putative addiction module killer protein